MSELKNPHLRALLADIDKELGVAPALKPGPRPHMNSPFRVPKLTSSVEVRKREKASRDQIEREHRVAFARPLIDAQLVSDAERLEIYNRVRGGTHWRGVGFSGGAK